MLVNLSLSLFFFACFAAFHCLLIVYREGRGALQWMGLSHLPLSTLNLLTLAAQSIGYREPSILGWL